MSRARDDHMGGFPFIASHFNVRELWTNGCRSRLPAYILLAEICSANRVRIITPRYLIRPLTINGVTVRCLNPLPSDPCGRERESNDKSLVIQLAFKGTKILFPGDLDRKGEKVMCGRFGPQDLKSTVLVAPRRGSSGPGGSKFMAFVRPEAVIFSVGAGNRYGFPGQRVLSKYAALGCRIFRTDVDGAVSITVGEDGCKIKPFR
jgi:competence protein ComEC